MKIVFGALLETMQKRADNSWKITIASQELSGEEIGKLNSFKAFVKVLISDNEITQLQEEALDKTQIAATAKNKTASQRLRASLWIEHQQSGLQVAFEDYYKTRMEEFIESVKQKLEQ